jgi:vancomycin resistance protein YoaR
MSQETASPREPSGSSRPPATKARARSERFGRALGRFRKRVRSIVLAVPVGRTLRSFGEHRRALFGTLLLVAAVLPPWLDRHLAGEDAVLGGVASGPVQLSRLSRAELTRVLEARARVLERRPLTIRVSGQRFVIEPRALGYAVDVPAQVKRALAVGRAGAVHERWFGYFRRWFAPVDIGVAAKLESARVAQEIAALAVRAGVEPPFPGGISVNGALATALPPRPGVRVGDALGPILERALAAPEAQAVEVPLVELPAPLPPKAAEPAAVQATQLLRAGVVLRSREPAAEFQFRAAELGPVLRTELEGGVLRLAFDAEKLASLLEPVKKSLEHEPVDAKFEVDALGAITIAPSSSGLRVDQERVAAALLAAAADPGRSAELPLRHEPAPALSSERAAGLGIRGLVSSFTTRHPCCERRVANIHRIADILNGRVVEPGQTVSVNDLVGPRTQKNGFVPAPTIEEGEMVDSLGGGISQFATTFFNALFHGGYDIVERQPHTYWFPRYPMGHEATLSWPKPDIIFKNDTAAGLLIKTSYTDTSITVKLYGDNGGRKVKAEVSGRQNVLPAPVEILPNQAVPPDEEKVKEPGSVGWSVIVSRIVTFADGTKKEERRRVTYNPRPKRVEVHPCRIPQGDKGYTGERCPEPEGVEELESDAASSG